MKAARLMRAIATGGAVATLSVPASGEGTVWLPAPGSGTFTVSYVSQEADEMWVGKNGPGPIPFKGLEQETVLFDMTYGISDAVALDASVGRSEVSPTHGRPIPIETDGRTDLNVGVTWRLMDELITGGASVAVRAGAILAGDYEAGGPGPVAVMGDASRVGAGPTAIGDGADGFEVSAIVGRIFGDRLALSAELGTRNRTSDVPRENFANLGGHWIVNPRLVLSLGYYIQDSTGDVDIGPPPGPGKHGTYWHRFPEVAEDIERVSLGGTLSVTDRINVGLHWFQVLDGRNTAEYDAFGGTLTYNFGL